jgi:hypothetical protein
MESRKILIYTTQGKTKQSYDINFEIWKDLKLFLTEKGYDMQNLKATENINRTNLEVDTAKLPTEDFTLYLRPVKTKSGCDRNDLLDMSFKDLRQTVRDFKEKYSEFDSWLKEKGNYTQFSTETLRNILIEYVSTVLTEEEISVEENTNTFATYRDKIQTFLNFLEEDKIAEKIFMDIDFIKTDCYSAIEYLEDNDEETLIATEKIEDEFKDEIKDIFGE